MSVPLDVNGFFLVKQTNCIKEYTRSCMYSIETLSSAAICTYSPASSNYRYRS